MVEGEVWLRAWVAVAGSFNAKEPDCVRYADACLKAFKERFDQPSTVPEKTVLRNLAGHEITPDYGYLSRVEVCRGNER